MKQVALVTGASSGIGKETVKRLVQEGLIVYAVARRVERMEDLKEMGAFTLKMDITDDEDVTNTVAAIIGKEGGIDILINNAGYAVFGAVEDSTLEDARKQFEVNFFGLANLTQKVLPYMRSRGKGTIINVSSVVGKLYSPLSGWYVATKYALEGWSDCLRIELSPFNIKVIIIQPGIIKTEFIDIASPSLAAHAVKSDYALMAKKMADSINNSNSLNGKASNPIIVSNIIAKAIKAKRPQTRYTIGYLAKPLLFVRWLLPDRFFDKLMLSQFK
ncbi:short-chain dehydrogenase/reductase [Flavobacterium sp. IR1]|nr:short-chain dehydrogenase/reductase [Flavobacterium sp. IR1]